MSNSTFFLQECPTCGRRVEVRVEYLAKRVTCQHCGGRFVAHDPANSDPTSDQSQTTLLRRAEELLDLAARRNVYGH